MISYNFKREFAPQIETGAAEPKILTLRRGRKPPSRHAQVGEPIGLWTGLRQKDGATRRGVGLVCLRGLLRFSENGIVHLSEHKVREPLPPLIASVEREIFDQDNDAFARRDGFENYDSLWRWHDGDRDKEERGQPALVRHLICWLPLSAEQIAGVETGAAQLEEVF